jgi:hypothetical protein
MMKGILYSRCLSIWVLCLFVLTYMLSSFLLVYERDVDEIIRNAPNITMAQYWPLLQATALADIALSLSSILLVGLWTLRMVPSSVIGRLCRGAFLYVLAILSGMILLVDVIMFLARCTLPVWYMLTYAPGQFLWYTWIGDPYTTFSIVVYNLAKGMFPLLTLIILGIVIFLPYILTGGRITFHQPPVKA